MVRGKKGWIENKENSVLIQLSRGSSLSEIGKEKVL